MTVADPSPADLFEEEPDDAAPASISASERETIRALNRIASGIDQLLAHVERLVAQPVQTGRPALAPLPPIQAQPVPIDGCPIHNAPWKTVPAGVSKKTGKPYEAFQACSIAGCDQRPRR